MTGLFLLCVASWAAPFAGEFMTGMMAMPCDDWKLSQLDHFNWMKQYGFNYMEPEYMWLEDGLSRWLFFESHDNVYNWFAMDHLVDDARKAGMRVYLDPSPFGFQPIPQWVWDANPDMIMMTPNGASDTLVSATVTPSLAHPGYRQAARDFFTAMAARYKDDPAVAGIIIGNERGCSNSSGEGETYYGLDYSNCVRDGFHQYLQDKYGTVAAMNSAWGKSYAGFNDVNWTGQWITNTANYRGEWLCYNLYRQKFVSDFYRELHDGIKSVAPNMPTMAVSLGIWANLRLCHGANMSNFDFPDLIGDKIYQWPNNHDAQQMMVDFCSSLTGKPYLCINQGILSQMYDYDLTPDDKIAMVRQPWEMVGRGGKGYLFWVWNEPTTGQQEKQSLITYDASGNPVVKDGFVAAFSENAKFIHKFDKLFVESEPYADNQIAMLDPNLTYIQLNPTLMATDVTKASFTGQLGQYQQWEEISTVLVHENYKVNHLSDDAMLGGRLDKCKVLVLCGTEYLYDSVAAKIEQWMATSGRYIVMTSNAGLKNEFGQSTTWKSRMTGTYGSRIKILTDNYINQTLEQLLAKAEVQSLYSFLASRVQRKVDIEGLTKRGDVTNDMLRYRDPATGKRTDLVVLVNRKTIGTDLTGFTLRVTEDCHYEAAYIFDPWNNHQPQPLTITRAGSYVRVPVSGVDHVRVVMLTEDPAMVNGDQGRSPGPTHEKLSAKARWWNATWPYRVAAQFYSAEHTGLDIVARCKLTTAQLPDLAGVDPASVRVVEYDRDWNMLAECQCTARIPATGQFEVHWKMPGSTTAARFRNFYIYMGATGVSPGTLTIPQTGAVKLEAEDTTSRSTAWWLKRQADGFGGKGLCLMRDVVDPSGYYLRYSFSVSQAGSYNIHVRNHGGFFGYAPQILDDFAVELDGSVIRSGVYNYDRVWQFLTVPVANLSVGTHNLKLTVKKQSADITLDYVLIAPSSYSPANPTLVDATWTGQLESSNLFADSFNTTTTAGNVNLEYDTGSRQSGQLAPMRWVERAETASGGSADGCTMVKHPWGGQNLDLLPTSMSWGSDATRYVWVSPDHSFTEGARLRIEVDVDPFANGSQPGTNWSAVIVGTGVPGTYAIPAQGLYGTVTSPGVGFVLSTDGAWTVYDNGALAASGTVTGHTGYYAVKVEIDGVGFAGTPVTLRFYIDGALAYSYTRSAGFSGNYITLAGLGLGTTGYQTQFFENFRVTLLDDSTAPSSSAYPAGGSYHWAQNVVLTADEPATIFYTTDGSQPTTASSAYLSPITIDRDTTLRFFAVDRTGNIESPVKTEAYTFAPVLFSDSFTPAVAGQAQYNINLGYDLGRQTGALAPIPWVERAETTAGGTYDAVTVIRHPWGGDDLELMCTGQSWGSDATKYIWAAPQHDFTESPSFTIDFDVDPFAYPSVDGPANWAAVIFGTYVPGTYVTTTQSAYGTVTSFGTAFTLTTNGQWTVYDDSKTQASGTVAAPHTGFYHVRVTSEASAFNGSPALIRFYVDGAQVYSYTRTTGFHANYITLSGLSTATNGYQDHFFDNFTVTAGVDKTGPTTTASPAGGIYSGSQSVTLTANESATIYYTLDGSEPTASSPVCTGPISIASDKVLRFYAVDSAGNAESPKKQETYTILSGDGSIAAAKLLPDGSAVELCGKALYYKAIGFGYIEEPDRTCGIRVEGTISPDEGDGVCLTGTVQTTAGGERYIALSAITEDGSVAVAPVGLTGRSLLAGISDGIRVKCWGTVKAGSVGANSFVLTDGSDGTGVRVITRTAPVVTEGGFVVVTGAAGFDSARVIYAD